MQKTDLNNTFRIVTEYYDKIYDNGNDEEGISNMKRTALDNIKDVINKPDSFERNNALLVGSIVSLFYNSDIDNILSQVNYAFDDTILGNNDELG